MNDNTPFFAMALIAASVSIAAADTTYLLDFGTSEEAVYQQSNTEEGDINYMIGAENGTGFDVDSVVGITNFNPEAIIGAPGDSYSFGPHALTMTSEYGVYNIGAEAERNSGVFNDFFFIKREQGEFATFEISGLDPGAQISFAFLHSQLWAIFLEFSTTPDFSANVISAGSDGNVDETTQFTTVGTLSGGEIIYARFTPAEDHQGEGDLSGLIINIAGGEQSE